MMVRKALSKRIFWSIRTASRKPTESVKASERMPYQNKLATDTFQREVANRRSYCAKPTKVPVGSRRELVNEYQIVQSVQPTNTTSTVAIIGVAAILAERLRVNIWRKTRPAFVSCRARSPWAVASVKVDPSVEENSGRPEEANRPLSGQTT